MRVTYIDPSEMVTQCNSVNDELKQQNEVLKQIDDVIIQAIKEEGLKGFAWDAIKELFTNHDAFIKLIIFANEKLISANEKLIQAMGKEVLDRRQIESNISNLQGSIVNNQKIITTYKNKANTIKKPSITDLMRGNVQTINMNLKAIEHLRKKIETMDSIEGNTANLYKEAAHLYGLAEKGIEILKDSWNGSTYIPIQPHDISRKTWAVSILKLVSDTKQKEKDLAKMVGNEPAELTNEIEKLRRQYEKGEITEDEVISKLLKGYGVDEYISQPSYSAAFGKKYNPEKKRELVKKVAMALVYVKGGEAYIEEQYKEYEKRYSNNYYDRNKLTHNTSYGVLPVDNPPKIPREEYFKQLVVDEMENVGKQAYSQEKLENDLAKAASAIVDGILIQRAYNNYGQTEKPSVEDVPQTKGNNPGVLETETTNVFGGSDATESGINSSIKNIQSKTPQQLIADGWEDVTNPKMAANTTSREFYDQKSGLKIRFDKGVDGANGFEAVDHYHIMNPNYTNKKVDYYLDIDGNPVGKGSKASHIVIKGE